VNYEFKKIFASNYNANYPFRSPPILKCAKNYIIILYTCKVSLLCMVLRWDCERQGEKKFRKSLFGFCRRTLSCYAGSGHYVSTRSDTNASRPPFIRRGSSLCQTRGVVVFHFRFEITRVMYTHACYDNNNNNNTNGGQKGWCVFTNFHRARLSTPDPYIHIL